ncbi:MAG: IS1 family transposase, partial [Symbiopectobacterium sp.]
IPHAFVPLLRKLLELLSGFRVAFWCTDGYRAYNDELTKAKHIPKNRFIYTIYKNS